MLGAVAAGSPVEAIEQQEKLEFPVYLAARIDLHSRFAANR